MAVRETSANVASVTVGSRVTEYGSFVVAMDVAVGANSPATVTLLQNATLDSSYDMQGGDVTFRGGNYTLTTNSTRALNVYGGKLIVETGHIVSEYINIGGGIINQSGLVVILGGTVDRVCVRNGSATVSGGMVTQLDIEGGSTTVSGGTIDELWAYDGSTTIMGGAVRSVKLSNGVTYQVKSVSVSSGGVTSVVAGETLQLTAAVDSEVQTGQIPVVWSSSDTSIATVDTDGLVTGVSAGTATITAAAGNPVKTDSVAITVTAPTMHTVTFDPGYGGADTFTKSVEHNTPVAEPTPAPTREGFVFKGWFSGNTAYDFGTKVTGNLTLTAHWTKAEATVTIGATTTPYETFEQAMNAATAEDVESATVHLLSDVTIDGVYAMKRGDVTFDGGQFAITAGIGGSLAFLDGVFTVVGGTVNISTDVFASGSLVVTGGHVARSVGVAGSMKVSGTGDVEGVSAQSGSSVEVTGGTVGYLSALSTSVVLSGGTIDEVRAWGDSDEPSVGMVDIKGTASVNNADADGGAINLYDGTVENASVLNDGEFHVYGGVITGNQSGLTWYATGLTVGVDGVTGNSATLEPGDTMQLKAAVQASHNHSELVPVTWKSDDETIAKIVLNENGTATVTAGTQIGTATITASVPSAAESDLATRTGNARRKLITAEFTVTVVEKMPEPPTPPSPSPSYQGIRIDSKPSKTEYAVGEKLDLTGLEVREYWSDGSSRKLSLNEYEVSGFDSSELGKRKVTVSLKRSPGYAASFEVTVVAGEVTVHRLYNTVSGEHLYTANTVERDHLASIGWRYEGVAFTMSTHGTPVHRLYLPGSMHLFTVNKSEYEHLKSSGWRDEGIAWYEPENGSTKVHRLYNPSNGDHLLTASAPEYTQVRQLPTWRDEGPAFAAR